MINLQLVQNIIFLLIFLLQVVQFFLIFAHSLKQLGIGLLSSQEFVNDFLNVTVACGGSYLLESVFDDEGLFHFFLHLFLEELTPHLLYHKVFS